MKLSKRKIKNGFFVFILLCILIGLIRFIPYYKQTRQDVYQLISTMDEGTFRRLGNTYVYDKNGKAIGKIGNEKYTYKESSDISTYIKNGYIAQEDKNFASHIGIDIKAILRATFSYIKNRGRITQGGSTITQQIVKNNLLSSERTFSRKFSEVLIAMAIEKTYTKAQIMEFYCNSNYYGNGCYGVEGAANYYFGKSANKLTLAEAAILVGTSNRPNDYNPVANYKKAMSKKREVLDSMLEEGYISKEEYKIAIAEKPKITKTTDTTDNDNYMVSYAIHATVLQIMEEEGFEFQYIFEDKESQENYRKQYSTTYSEISTRVRSGGYKIYTSFDQKKQKELQRSVSKYLKKNKLQGAAVCIDNKTGRVVAMVGGVDEKDEYNRGFLMERNPGSSIKPLLVYGTALNEGVVMAGSEVEDKEIDYNGYSPKNAGNSYLGVLTVREALARSLNTVAVQLYHDVGVSTALDYLGQLKFSSLSYADNHNLSLSLGGFTNGVRVVDMAKGYATIAGKGKYSNATCLEKIKKEDGSVLYEYNNDTREVYNEDTAFILSSMMQGVFREEYGTAHKSYNSNLFLAGKTGTTDNNKDAWFCGFSTAYTTAVWVGCDTPKSVNGLTGNSYPLSIFMNYMEKITQREDFSAPSTISLINKEGTKEPLEDSDDLYKSRPDDFDYYSKLTEKNLEERAFQKRIQKEKKAAEKAVSAFEKFKIKSISDVERLEKKYQEVLNIIEKIEYPTEQVSYKERAEYKYNTLSGRVKDKWNALIAEEEAEEQARINLENQEEAAKSEEEASNKIKELKQRVVYWYIDSLYNQTLYTESVKGMITDAQSALEKCKGHDEYNALQDSLNSAITYAESLPLPETETTEETPNDYTNVIEYEN